MKQLQDHVHIIQIYWSYTCGRERGMLLTPVVSHKDLGAYMLDIKDKGDPLTSAQCAVLTRAFGCLASGLAHIHSHAVRHKDIKPKNILIQDGRVIHADFGVALDTSGQDTLLSVWPQGFRDDTALSKSRITNRETESLTSSP
jgi:serine/threonine protein kinase